MKIERRILTVKLGDVSDQAILKFDELRENNRARINYLLTKARDASDSMLAESFVNEYRQLILGLCISVENLFEGEHAVTIEDVKGAALYSSTINAIIQAFLTGMRGDSDAEAAEKNDSTSDASNE